MEWLQVGAGWDLCCLDTFLHYGLTNDRTHTLYSLWPGNLFPSIFSFDLQPPCELDRTGINDDLFTDGETEAWRWKVALAQVPQQAKPGLERTQASGQDSSHHSLLPPENGESKELNGDVGEASEAKCS